MLQHRHGTDAVLKVEVGSDRLRSPPSSHPMGSGLSPFAPSPDHLSPGPGIARSDGYPLWRKGQSFLKEPKSPVPSTETEPHGHLSYIPINKVSHPSHGCLGEQKPYQGTLWTTTLASTAGGLSPQPAGPADSVISAHRAQNRRCKMTQTVGYTNSLEMQTTV